MAGTTNVMGRIDPRTTVVRTLGTRPFGPVRLIYDRTP